MASIRYRPRSKKPHTKADRTASVNKYKRKTQKVILLNISKVYDKDIIGWLENNKPYQTAFKWLVREQIKKEEREADVENAKET